MNRLLETICILLHNHNLSDELVVTVDTLTTSNSSSETFSGDIPENPRSLSSETNFPEKCKLPLNIESKTKLYFFFCYNCSFAKLHFSQFHKKRTLAEKFGGV